MTILVYMVRFTKRGRAMRKSVDDILEMVVFCLLAAFLLLLFLGF